MQSRQQRKVDAEVSLEGTRARIDAIRLKGRAMRFVALGFFVLIWLGRGASDHMWSSPHVPESVGYYAVVPRELARFLDNNGIPAQDVTLADDPLGPTASERNSLLVTCIIIVVVGLAFAAKLNRAGIMWRALLTIGPIASALIFAIEMGVEPFDPRITGSKFIKPEVHFKAVPTGKFWRDENPHFETVLQSADTALLREEVAFVRAQIASSNVDRDAIEHAISKVTTPWPGVTGYEKLRLALMLDQIHKDGSDFEKLRRWVEPYRPGFWRRLPAVIWSQAFIYQLCLLLFVLPRSQIIVSRAKRYKRRLDAIAASGPVKFQVEEGRKVFGTATR